MTLRTRPRSAAGANLRYQNWLRNLREENRRDLLEILEDRHGSRSTLATSQLPVEKWHDMIGDPTLVDAILDRLVHNVGARCLQRRSTMSCCLSRRFSATTAHTPPGPSSFAVVTARWIVMRIMSFMRLLD
jgi:hypothetical protein